MINNHLKLSSPLLLKYNIMIEFTSQLSVEEYIIRLKNNTGILMSFSAFRQINYNKIYLCKFRGNKFKIRKNHLSRNSFFPIFKGTITKISDRSSKIAGDFINTKILQSFYTFGFIFFSIIILLLIFTGNFSFNNLFFFLIPTIIMIFIKILFRFGINFYENECENLHKFLIDLSK